MKVRGFELARSFSFAGGQLLLFKRRPPRLKSYQDPSREAQVRMFFVRHHKRIPIRQLADLASVGDAVERVDIHGDIESNLDEFAQLVCDLMKWGSVVRDAERFEYLRRDRGIDLAGCAPRVVGNELRFVSARFDLSAGSPHLLEVSVDLDNFESEAKAMPQKAN